jgi:ankyrin repeat protein
MTALLANPRTNVNLPVGDEESPPLQSAMAQNRLGIFRLLLANPRTKVDAKNENGFTIVHQAASLNSPDFMKAALATGKVDVNALTKDKAAPIHLAAKNSPDCLKLLLASPKIKANFLDGEGHSAVYYAAFENPDSLKLLLKSPKVKLSVKDKAALKEAAKPHHGDLG